MQLKLFFLLALLMFYSCNSNPFNSRNEESLNDLQQKLELNEINESDTVNIFSNKIATIAGLTKLNNGYDSIYLRVWIACSGRKDLQVIEIINDKDIWRAKIILLTAIYKNDSISNFKTESESKNPISGWSFFVQDLSSNEIFSLPDYRRLKGYNSSMVTDGNEVLFEISSKGFYRKYSYVGLRENISFEEAKKVMKILELLSNELEVKFNCEI